MKPIVSNIVQDELQIIFFGRTGEMTKMINKTHEQYPLGQIRLASKSGYFGPYFTSKMLTLFANSEKMSNIYHINIGAYNTDTHAVGTHTVRIWAHLLASVHWVFNKPLPGHFLVLHGISMTLINNMAISLEGFIGDICWEHAQNKPQAPLVADIDHMTWKKKRSVYNKLFSKKLDDYDEYEGITMLLQFRNNLAHGRTYTELSKRELAGTAVLPVETENKAYQDLRDYLIKNKLLEARTIPSNVEVPWKLEAAMHFVGLAKHFMENIMRENESDNKLGIETEYKLACSRW